MIMDLSQREEIEQISTNKPHIVILGAGASIASFLKGDKNGNKLPSMLNFVDVLNLTTLLSKCWNQAYR
jgi:hypothetical protein